MRSALMYHLHCGDVQFHVENSCLACIPFSMLAGTRFHALAAAKCFRSCADSGRCRGVVLLQILMFGSGHSLTFSSPNGFDHPREVGLFCRFRRAFSAARVSGYWRMSSRSVKTAWSFLPSAASCRAALNMLVADSSSKSESSSSKLVGRSGKVLIDSGGSERSNEYGKGGGSLSEAELAPEVRTL